MSKYSTEFKLEIVEACISGKLSKKGASKQYKTDKSNIVKWVAAYEQHGVEGLTTCNKTYSGDFKLSVIKYMRNTGSSARQTAAYFNIPSYNSVIEWERKFLQGGSDALYNEHRGRKNMNKKPKTKKAKLDKETEYDLIAEVKRLRMENEYLKKLNALIQKKITSATKIE